MTAPLHTHDVDCAATLDLNDQCTVCGVSHGAPCGECLGRGFHQDACPEMAGDAVDAATVAIEARS